MPHSIPHFFESYANLYNRALAGEDVFGEVMDRFAPTFMAAGPDGADCSRNGPAFRRTLDKGYRFYRSIGTKKMTARRVEVTRIDGNHCLAKVSFCSDYVRRSGEALKIEFGVSYLLDTAGAKPKILAFIAGDEMELYRTHGLLHKAPAAGDQTRHSSGQVTH